MTAAERRGGPAGNRTTIGAARDRPCTLVVCRGCCCGNPHKYPGTDHSWQLDRLLAAAEQSGGRLAVRVTDCLGPCDRANVIVVQPSGEGRRGGGRAVWLGWALDDDCTDEILAWVKAGGPGVVDPPPALELQFFKPPGVEGRSARDRRTRTAGRRARR